MTHMSNVILPAGTPDFVLTRVFDAPRPLVYRCWMDPGHLARWWGPKPFTCPVCEVDPRVGGKFRLVMRGPDGTDYPMTGTFREIVPDVRIVKEDDVSEHSEEWHDMVDPDRKGQGKRKIELLTTITFEDQGKATLVTVRTVFPSLRLRDNFARIGMKEGWSSSLEKLEDLLDAVKDKPDEIHFTRLFDAPRATVFGCFRDPANLGKWWGPNGFSTTTHAMEFRVGGVWSFTMHGPDGRDYPNYVSYTEIVPPAVIRYDHGTSAENPRLFRAEILLAEENGKTRVSLKLSLADARQRDEMVAFGAVEGGWQTLSRLADYLRSD